MEKTGINLNKVEMKKASLLLFLALLVIGLTSCDDTVVFEENRSFEKGVWNYHEPAIFIFDVEDTVSRNDFFINLRNGDAYPFMNAFLFVRMDFPNGRTSIDTLECFLADQAGRWLGTGLGDIYDNRFLFKQQKAFPISGQYRIEIRQAMRVDDLPEIYDVGLRIARSK